VRGSFASLISRKSEAALHSIIERKTAAETNKAVTRALKKLPTEAKRMLTIYNGTENAKYAFYPLWYDPITMIH
jgi:IS30 family transposase